MNWLDDPDVCVETFVPQTSLVDGRLYVLPCSEALTAYVHDHDGQVAHTVEGGILKLTNEAKEVA